MDSGRIQADPQAPREGKERLQNLAPFPPLPMVNEGSVVMSTETASSQRRVDKINLKEILNEDKQLSGTPRTITIKNIELINTEKKNTKSEEKKVIDISSNTDTFDDLTSISESTTEDSSCIFAIEQGHPLMKTHQHQVYIKGRI